MSSIINGIDANQTLKKSDNVIFNTVTSTGGYNTSTISTTTTLTSGAFGTQVICTGSSAYAVTLPASTSGTYIDIFVNTSSFALVTITPPAGTIQNQSTFILGSGESCRVYGDGTNYWVQNYYMQPASFLVGLTGGQSIPNNTKTKVTFSLEVYDVGGFFDNVTNYRYQPLYPGKYQFYFASQFVAFANSNVLITNTIALNGTDESDLRNNSASGASPVASYASITLPMNGSTDYVEFDIYQNDNRSNTLSNAIQTTYGGGYRISNF